MAISVTELVVIGIPVVRQLEHRVLTLIAVTHKRQGETARGVLLTTQKTHSQHLGVEAQRALQIPYPEHGVQHAHLRRSPGLSQHGAKAHKGGAGGDP